jgi:putative endonuclease
VFVEVRMRAYNAFGGAAASITAVKRAKLLKTARYYLAGNTHPPACRFDALLLTGPEHVVEWIKDAFGE